MKIWCLNFQCQLALGTRVSCYYQAKCAKFQFRCIRFSQYFVSFSWFVHQLTTCQKSITYMQCNHSYVRYKPESLTGLTSSSNRSITTRHHSIITWWTCFHTFSTFSIKIHWIVRTRNYVDRKLNYTKSKGITSMLNSYPCRSVQTTIIKIIINY